MDPVLRLLVQNHLVRLPSAASSDPVGKDVLATLMSNVAAFGYALSKEALDALQRSSDGGARAWWEDLEPVLMDLSGADRKMDQHVVYKNFPHEVIAMDQAEYWLKQILMYWGLPNDLFTEAPSARPPIDEPIRGKVLHPATPDSLEKILRALIEATTRWTNEQKGSAGLIAKHFGKRLDLARVKFKENMVALAIQCLARDVPVTIDSATDVLRLAFGMTDGGDVSLREKTKLRKFKRSERRFLLALLEGSTNLDADMARRPERFKRLVHALHPGDWPEKYPRTIAAADRLYKDTLPPTDAAVVEQRLLARDARLLDELKGRPGDFARRLHHLVLVYGHDALVAFAEVVPRLGVHRLLQLERYFAKINERRFRTFPPKGDWSALQIVPSDPNRRLSHASLKHILGAVGASLEGRVRKRVPLVKLSKEAKLVKLPTNDTDLLPYGRGTVFPLPASVRFVRTAVYWRTQAGGGNVWYDNGWNFFDDKWADKGVICWNANRYPFSAPYDKKTTTPEPTIGAIFSGDPTSSKDSEGRACQMIDLYPDVLATLGVRYAVWNVLCYSRLTFDEAEEVFAGLQWGSEADKGALFEASRTQLAFPVKGKQYTKYIALLDLAKRELVYLDANLRASTSSASANGKKLSAQMPAFMEYIDSLPSVHDAFIHSVASEAGMPVLYTDAGHPVRGGPAWVFKPANEASHFDPFPLASLLAD